jgi:hypothetical protein
MVYDKKGNFSGTTNDLVETFARMSMEQRQDFVEVLTKKWPHMAFTLSSWIGFEIQSNQEEAK